MKEFYKLFTNGIVRENPLVVLMIGLCSALAVTTAVANGIGMGISMTFVLLMSQLVISVFRKLIPSAVRIPVFIIVIASFTTVVDYVLKAFSPSLSAAMGLFIPLIVVNCIIMGRVEGFASKQVPWKVIPDSLGMGLGYTWVLTGIALVRELLGSGTILGFPVLGDSFEPILFFVMAPGGFFVFGVFISINMAIKKAMAASKAKASAASGAGAAISEGGAA